MNKIKVLYEVFKAMKDREVIKGSLNVNGERDGVRFLKFENNFEKNMKTGYTKAKLSTEFNSEGKSFKHESSTEFDMGKFEGHGHRHFMKHGYHHGQFSDGEKFGGPRQGLSKITFLFGLLNSLKLEEMEDNGALLTLNTKDFPDEMKKTFTEGMTHKKFYSEHDKVEFDERVMGGEHHGHHALMKELQGIVDPNIELNVWVNKDSEIEKILINASGKGTEENEAKDISMKAELKLIA